MEALEFRFGPLGSLAPFLSFLILVMICIYFGVPTINSLLLCVLIGLIIGIAFAKNIYQYCEAICEGMASKLAGVAVICWLYADLYGGMLRSAKIAEGLIWLGHEFSFTGGFFVAFTFMACALYATGCGTGIGTIATFTPFMYPAGIALGANPGVLAAAILSGATFGDNLAPVSDTTIISAASQDTDIGGVVRSRFKYAIIAATCAFLLFAIMGGHGEVTKDLVIEAGPKGLIMLVSPALVIAAALIGRHFLEAITWGILCTLVTGPLVGVFSYSDLVRIEHGSLVGSAVDGLVGMLGVCILALLLTAISLLMQRGGLFQWVKTRILPKIATNIRSAEFSIISLVSVMNLCIPVNTVAMIASGPWVKEIGEEFKLHPYRRANLMDSISNSFVYAIPWCAPMLAIIASIRATSFSYPFIPLLNWASIAPYHYYGYSLLIVMILAALTGFGRKFEQ